MACIVYIATRMTGRDRPEMVRRAKYVSSILRQYGLKPISPVIEEGVKASPGTLSQSSEEILKGYWKRDKHIIRRISHVLLWDQADNKSMGCEREYCLNRGVLWKPTIIHTPSQGISIARFEDDYITSDIREAARFIRDTWGTRWKRWKWRFNMLRHSLPKWVMDQIMAWR